MLNRFNSRQLLGELIRLGYSSGQSLEIIGVAKKSQEQVTADITVASERTKVYMTQYPLILNGDRITVTATPHPSSQAKTPGAALTTTVIIKNIPLQYSQSQVTLALHRLMGAKNMISISYSNADNDSIGRHEGTALIRCLNAAIYTYWSHRHAFPFLGKFVDFVPYRRSIAGSNPNEESKAHDTRPTREIISDKISAFKNELAPSPSLSQFEDSIKSVEGCLEKKLDGLRDTINSHTTKAIDVSSAANASRHAYILRQLQSLTRASQEYNNKIVGITSAIA